LIKDGKLNAAWLMLAPAVARGLLAMEKAEEWLRKAAEACGVDPEPYIEKFRREVERRKGRPEGSPELALPTWRSLLARRKKDGSPLEDYYEAIRKPLLEALVEKGLVRWQAVAAAALSNCSAPIGYSSTFTQTSIIRRIAGDGLERTLKQAFGASSGARFLYLGRKG
jgi:hypothetical protein